MGWPVEVLKRWMSAEEFDLWCRYYRHHPFDDQSNFHVPIAALQAQVATAFGGKATLKDFLIFRDKEEDEVDLDEKFRRFFAQLRSPDDDPEDPA